MAQQKFYQKATVQVAIATAIGLIIAALISESLPLVFKIPELTAQITELQQENLEKNLEIQRLETLLTPFKTLALQRYTGTDTEVLSKLASRVQEIETMVYTLQTYSDVAKMDITGNPGIVGTPPISLTTPISRKLSGVFTDENGQKIFTCNEDALQKYRKVIEEFPRFPFAYYMLAVCYNRAKNEDWKPLAKEAISIF
ncbi:hypothetical protein JW887_04080 [Candidatus Dojkabacteria bacterium]|nr:hypothetical protein [Candidatus Dojkabacteria bacterium]